MKPDILNQEDLLHIVQKFYKSLLLDDDLLPFFNKFKDPKVLEPHLHDLAVFWNSTLFYTGEYNKNVMHIHKKINEQTPMLNSHFDRWITLFEEAVDSSFEGLNATTLKNRARSIATVMRIKFRP